MARVIADNNANSDKKPRAEKITEGSKVCSVLGHYFQTINSNKYLCVGYVVIDQLDTNPEESEVGCIHIEKMLIRDTVAWKHSKWAGALGFVGGYDNENHADIQRVILGCDAVRVTFKNYEYEYNGEERSRLEIGDMRPIKDELNIVDGVVQLSEFHHKVVTSAEEGFGKIVKYRKDSGEIIDSPPANLVISDGNDDIDRLISKAEKDGIPF